MADKFSKYELSAQQAAVWIVEKGAKALQHTSNAFDFHGDFHEEERYHLVQATNDIAELRELCDILEGHIKHAFSIADAPPEEEAA
jgi:hypothetical protein